MSRDATSKVSDNPSKGERTRAKLLEVAAAEFARLGYHNTKVGDIVKRAGVSQPAFYIYFESKEAAYEELVAEFRGRLHALTKTLLIADEIAGQELIDRVALSFLRFFDFLADDPNLTEIGFFQPPGCTETKTGLASWIATNIAKEQKSGLFRDDIPSVQIGSLFVGMIDQMVREWAGPAKRAKLARNCALLLCHGIAVG
jgi:TetR/AcrR family fatty acid metabolism transcriptional regulator